MNRRPTVTGPVQWGEQPVVSFTELADRLGRAVWVPPTWPIPRRPFEVLMMLSPSGHDHGAAYQLRSHDPVQRPSLTPVQEPFLIVLGVWRREGANLESGLERLDGERFETWSRTPDQPPHLVVRAPVFDVHVSGSIPYDTALAAARSLIEVAPGG